jgi:hypothetical protein
MRQSSGRLMKAHFLGWQCRIRQMSVREFGGQPMPAMRPCVSTKDGKVISPAVVLLLVPEEPAASTAFFKFQVQKTNEPEEAREAALRYLGAEYFQIPELFSDEMTAVYAPASSTAASLVRFTDVRLDFEQYSQTFCICCSVRILGPREPARESSFWQALLFNPNLPKDAKVLSFKPDWRKATAKPMPQYHDPAKIGY